MSLTVSPGYTPRLIAITLLIRHPLQIVGFSSSLTVIPLRNYGSSIDTTIPVRIIYFFHRKPRFLEGRGGNSGYVLPCYPGPFEEGKGWVITPNQQILNMYFLEPQPRMINQEERITGGTFGSTLFRKPKCIEKIPDSFIPSVILIRVGLSETEQFTAHSVPAQRVASTSRTNIDLSRKTLRTRRRP